MNVLGKEITRKRLYEKLVRTAPNLALRIYPPDGVSIEASSACNIKCLCCPVGHKLIEGRNTSLENFKHIVDLLPAYIRRVDFSHRGDPAMNPNLSKMVQYAHQKGLHTDVYTNGLFLDKHIDTLVESGMDILRVDVDGATEESYLRYRIGSDYGKVKDNIRRLVEARARSKGRYPSQIIIICVVSSFNEHEIPEIQKMAEELKVDAILFKTAIINYGCNIYNDAESQAKMAPRNKAYRRALRSKDFICPFLRRGSILYNGDMSLCCADFEKKHLMGNVLEENSYEKVFFSSKAREVRRHALNQTSICKTCAVIAENHYMPDISRKFTDSGMYSCQ